MNTLWTFGDSFTAGHGCKFDASGAFSNSLETYYKKLYDDYIDINKKIWPEIVADTLSFELLNYGKNGMTNESIADSILKHLPSIQKNDIVILQTSTLGRFDFPFLKEKTLFGNFSKKYDRDDELFDMSNSPYFFKTIFLSNIEKEYSDDVKDVLKYSNAQESLKNENVILDKHKYDIVRGFFSEFITTEKYYERSVWRIVQISNILNLIGIKNYIINETAWPQHLLKQNNLIEMHINGMTGYINNTKKTIYHKTNGLIDDFHPSYEGHDDIANFILKFIENETTNIYNS